MCKLEKQYIIIKMILSKENLNLISKGNVISPTNEIFSLPESVLQFGTGVLLRGLPDYFIDKANRQGVFNGRVVVVKSTGTNTSEFDQQDALYTLCIRGIENGQPVSENIISSAISRVVAADKDWDQILTLAKSEELKLIVSNTTEVGIALVKERIDQHPPVSFPAKVLAVLYARYEAFNGSADAGLVIVATELIPDNGKKLESIVHTLAEFNELSPAFISWLKENNEFCNSLVDRIVPGKPDAATLAQLEEELGYKDHLLSMSEPYRLWAIEGGEKVAKAMSFAQVDSGVVIAPDIEIYRELKVRLLNGTHTLTSGVAFLLGIDTVKAAMGNEEIKAYVNALMAQEISPAIPYEVTEAQTTAFAATVVDRFANPSIAHLWASIAFQFSMKMKIRVLPVLLNYFKVFGKVPVHIAFGFAAYLRFSKVTAEREGKFFGSYGGNEYAITDDSSSYFAGIAALEGEDYVRQVLSDQAFWGADLGSLPGFIEEVAAKYEVIDGGSIAVALSDLTSDKLDVI